VNYRAGLQASSVANAISWRCWSEAGGPDDGVVVLRWRRGLMVSPMVVFLGCRHRKYGICLVLNAPSRINLRRSGWSPPNMVACAYDPRLPSRAFLEWDRLSRLLRLSYPFPLRSDIPRTRTTGFLYKLRSTSITGVDRLASAV